MVALGSNGIIWNGVGFLEQDVMHVIQYPVDVGTSVLREGLDDITASAI
jgi:hypothetical protein